MSRTALNNIWVWICHFLLCWMHPHKHTYLDYPRGNSAPTATLESCSKNRQHAKILPPSCSFSWLFISLVEQRKSDLKTKRLWHSPACLLPWIKYFCQYKCRCHFSLKEHTTIFVNRLIFQLLKTPKAKLRYATLKVLPPDPEIGWMDSKTEKLNCLPFGVVGKLA